MRPEPKSSTITGGFWKFHGLDAVVVAARSLECEQFPDLPA